MFSFSVAVLQGQLHFILTNLPELLGKRSHFLPYLVRVPICMHKISILICRVVVVYINTQFTNASACFHPQTMGFFFHSPNVLSQI